MDAAYVASATSKGGRMGHVRSESGFVDQDVAVPTELGGPGGATNPEELLPAGWATCFMSALGLLCAKREIDTSEATVTANVGVDLGKGGFDLVAEMVVRLPGMERAMAEKLVSRTHEICPFSRALTSVPVEITIAEPVAA